MTGETRVSQFYFGVVVAFSVALYSVGVAQPGPFSYLLNLFGYFAGWVLLASAHCLPRLYRDRPNRPIGHLWRHEFGPEYRQRFRQSWPILLIAVLFMPGFSAMKSAISLFQDFSWDATFIALDRSLHGQDPWRLLQPLVGYPIITSLLSLAYHAWIFLLYAGTIYFTLYVRDRTLRVRYFAAYFGIWTINGVVLAIMFASVGPCFVGPLLGNNHFADQMAYLHRANESFPVMVLPVQQMLLDWQMHGSHGLGRGITAMPSMHVALAFLFFLAIRKVNRTLGLLFFAFLVIIMVGSVHLAYHYAVDAYLSLIVTAVIWFLCGRLFRAPVSAEQDDRSLPGDSPTLTSQAVSIQMADNRG